MHILKFMLIIVAIEVDVGRLVLGEANQGAEPILIERVPWFAYL